MKTKTFFFYLFYQCIRPDGLIYKIYSKSKIIWIEKRWLTALSFFWFVRVVEAIVVAVANVDPRDAVAVVAREQVAVASSIGGSALEI